MSVIIIIMSMMMTVIVVMMVITMKLMFRQPVCTRLVQEEDWASRWKELSMSRRESRSLSSSFCNAYEFCSDDDDGDDDDDDGDGDGDDTDDDDDGDDDGNNGGGGQDDGNQW